MASPWLERAWWQSWLLQPNLAAAVLAAGCVLLLLEFHRPGRVIYGAAGVLFTLAAAWGLAQHPLRPTAVAMLVCGLGLLLLETRVGSAGSAAVVGVSLLSYGLHALILPAAQPIGWGLALLAGCGVGGAAFLLASFARRARQRKYALGPQSD